MDSILVKSPSKDLKEVIGNLSIYEFEEDGYQYVYCPGLDITGYGNSLREAKNSLDINFKEFFEFLIKENNLDKELLKLGWKKTDHTFKIAGIQAMLSSNKQFQELLSNKKYNRAFENVDIRVHA